MRAGAAVYYSQIGYPSTGRIAVIAALLRKLHCVSYSKCSPSRRGQLEQSVIPFFFFIIKKQRKAARKNGNKRGSKYRWVDHGRFEKHKSPSATADLKADRPLCLEERTGLGHCFLLN